MLMKVAWRLTERCSRVLLLPGSHYCIFPIKFGTFVLLTTPIMFLKIYVFIRRYVSSRGLVFDAPRVR